MVEAFRKLGIIEEILRTLEDKDFETPTYIQEKSIPPILEGKDVIGQSETGSGKTLAFGCGIIQNIDKGKGLQAVVLTPTRELAEQVCEALAEFSQYKFLRVTPVYGGVAINPQINKLTTADVVVATPGRILDHIERKTVNLTKVKMLVLDEADRMVDMGFIDEVNKIIAKCPKYRQTLLFSATLSEDIQKIKNKYMKDPISIRAKAQVDPTKLKQIYYDVRDHMKFSLLVHLLGEEHSGLVLIFCNTRNQADFLAKNLKFNKLNAIAIHGGFTQAKRSSSMEDFKSGKETILVCTDVAARGLDIPGVSHVYNYDIPGDPKEYVHRIGRTARAGKDGKVINILAPMDHNNFSNIFRMHSDLNVPKEDVPTFQKAPIKQSSFVKKKKNSFRNKGFNRGRRR
jgi:ATP-dependent RNA helicase DeaD